MIRYNGEGVAMMMIARAKGALMEWMPINKSIITARFYSKYKKLTVLKAYAPKNDAMDKENNELYNQLPDTVSDCNGNDIMAVKGDLNANVAKNNTNREEVVGKLEQISLKKTSISLPGGHQMGGQ